MARTFTTVWMILAVALTLTAGCKKAPEPPTGEPPGDLTLYQAFHADVELLEPLLEPLLEEGLEYMDSDEFGDCYRIMDLTPCDAQSVCVGWADPTGIPSITHAEIIEYPVSDVVAAMMLDDWAELYPNNYNTYEIVDETNREEFDAGTANFYTRSYQGTLPVLTAEIAIYTNLQWRRVVDWAGTGEPAIIIRGWYPTEPVSNSDSVTSTMMFSFEVLLPRDDGASTFRWFATWSDLSIGGYDPSNAWGIACNSSKAGWDSINDYLDEQSE